MFGYEAGAFTGARKDGNPGKFELANGGTIFLDEIADMPLELQASLLRVLQSREITRIGSTRSIQVNVRVIAATNGNLRELIQEKRFRADLFYRLNVLSIEMPPLRKRKEDIIPLASYFLREYKNISNKEIIGFSEAAKKTLINYKWPGNVRELENVIERSINIAENNVIMNSDLPRALLEESFPNSTLISNNSSQTEYWEKSTYVSPNQEKEMIIDSLKLHFGDVTAVSLHLSIPKRTLYRRFKKYKIDLQSYRQW